MSMDELINFLKTDIWGLIVLGGLGSILGSILIYLTRKLYFWLAKHYRLLRTKSYFNRIVERYSEGYMAGFASKSDVRQTALIGRYIVNLILSSTLLLGILLITFGLLSFLPFQAFWIVIFSAGILIVFPIRKIKKTLWLFNHTYEQHFDQEDIKKKANEHLANRLQELKDKKEK